MTFFLILISIYWIFLGAIWGRIDGGGIAKVSEWVERILVMISFVISTATFASVWSLFALIGVAGIATGHGQWFLSRTIKAIGPEKLDFIVKLFFGQDPRTKEGYKAWRDDNWINVPDAIVEEIAREMKAYGDKKLYWRCVFGMFVSGTLVGLPAFVLCMLYQQWYGVLFLLTGVVKAASYVIGWTFFKSTEPAEYINGGGRNLICFLVMYLALMTIL